MGSHPIKEDIAGQPLLCPLTNQHQSAERIADAGPASYAVQTPSYLLPRPDAFPVKPVGPADFAIPDKPLAFRRLSCPHFSESQLSMPRILRTSATKRSLFVS